MAVAITVNPTVKTLNVGQHQKITATVTGGTAGQTWASGTPAVATVDAAGLVTAIAPGTAVITATSTADVTKTATTAIAIKDSHALHIADRHNNYIQSLLQDRIEGLDPRNPEAVLAKACLTDLRSFGND